jgi:hypothetical protein
VEVLFVDETHQVGQRAGMGRLLALGGVLLGEETLWGLAHRIDVICHQFGIPDGCQLKWSPPPDNWIHHNLTGERRTDCYGQVLDAVSQSGGRGIVVAIDTGRTAPTLQGSHALLRAFQWVYERTVMQLEQEGHRGLIIADRPSGNRRQETELLGEVLETIEEGTAYVPPNTIPINVLTTPARLVRHLQVADLVVGVTTAMLTGAGRYAEPLFGAVQAMLVRSADGLAGGAGLKLFPPSLTNLYHWVLGEPRYARRRQDREWRLPSPEFAYYLDDGRTPATRAHHDRPSRPH